MLAGDQKILNTLELLVTLSNSRRRFSHDLSDEEKETLTVSKQLITDSGLTIFQFVRALKKLGDKGYIQYFVIYDEHIRSQIDEQLKKEGLEAELKKLEVHDTKELSDRMKTETIDSINKIAPAGKKLNPEDSKDEFIKISDASRGGIELYKKLRPDEIAMIFILPFRSLERLYEKMDADIRFEQVQDTNIWYEPAKYRLHVGNHIFNTGNRGSATRVHHILNKLFSEQNISDFVVDYTDVEYFDDIDGIEKENKRHYLSMYTFLKTNGKLRDIFINHSDRLEVNPKYKDDVN